MQYCKRQYEDIGTHLDAMFAPREALKCTSLDALNFDEALAACYSTTAIQTDAKMDDGTPIAWTLLPRGNMSVRVLAEVPIVCVLLYQQHKQHIHNDIADLIPTVLNMITLQVRQEYKYVDRRVSVVFHPSRNHPNFNRELYIEFMNAQCKTLSFIAFLVRMFTVKNKFF
jgi:transformation/transcription domain-associated protein